MSGALTILEGAKRIVEEEGWCQCHVAIDEHGCSVDSASEAAIAWCMSGAMMRVHYYDGSYQAGYLAANTLLRRAIKKREGAFFSVDEWNDMRNRNLAEVSAMFDEAIAMAGGPSHDTFC